MKFFSLLKIKSSVEKVLGLRTKKNINLIAGSELFNWKMFAEQFSSEENILSKKEAIRYYLKHPEYWNREVSENFDGEWYLHNYEDVLRSGQNPLIHYLEHGAREGRIPVQNLALPYEKHLWAGLEDIMLPKLANLVAGGETNLLQKSYALWALARWHAWKSEQSTAVEYLKTFHKLKAVLPSHQGPTLLLISLLIELRSFRDASKWIEFGKSKFQKSNDLALLESNLLSKQNSLTADDRLEKINQIYRKYKLPPLDRREQDKSLSLNNIRSISGKSCNHERTVSVIVPCFNAAHCIGRALDSLLAQTWNRLEVIVVDDASHDGSAEMVERWIAKNTRSFGEKTFLLERKLENTGAYISRNIGMSLASGQYLTVHDADDFSHSCKIEQQVLSLEAKKAVASISYWVRCNNALFFERWRMEDALIYRNVSSLMIKKKVLNDLGYWDQVRFGADTEYYERILAHYGEQAITEVLPEVPLSFGLSDDSSLTQTKSSHLITQFAGVRKDYMCSARLWHQNEDNKLYLAKDTKIRKFPIPDELLSGSQVNVAPSNFEDALRYSPHWSETWYVRRYKPTQGLSIDPLVHFTQSGLDLGFEIGPSLSLSYLNNFCNLSIHSYLGGEIIRKEFVNPPFYVEGDAAMEGSSVLICAHAADLKLFGAELSLVDMVKAAAANGFQVTTALPSAANKSYINTLKPYCNRIYFVNDTWWQQGISQTPEIVEHYTQIIKKEKVSLVHVNTLVQCNIYEAAKKENIPIITHVRESLNSDSELRTTLCSSSSAGYKRILESSTIVIANSFNTKQDIINSLETSEIILPNIEVVPNVFDVHKSSIQSSCSKPGGVVRFGLVSSNIAKKGVEDAISLASALEQRGVKNIQIVLIGPMTDLIEKLIREQRSGLHRLVKYVGFINKPEEIYKNLDVVLNLSHFAESFGRTILEGMAFGKPSLCYDHGALRELVTDAQTGYLVPFLDHDMLVCCAEKLANANDTYERLSKNAQEKAIDKYSMTAYKASMERIYWRAIQCDLSSH